MRYFIELAYFGKNYHGWQIQPNAVSIQEKIEDCLQQLFQHKIEIVGAGRTDAGVHAKQIFAHFDLAEETDPKSLLYKLNGMLPQDIAVKQIFKVKPDTHARFDAVKRSYEYHIITEKNPFLIDRAFYLKNKPDIVKMNQAAEILKTYTNFKSFSKSRTDVKTYNCKVEEAFWEEKDNLLVFHISADRFLRNMVRAIVGSLLDIGLGKTEVEEMHKIIQSKDRGKAGASVPARGLYLTKVEYPEIAL